MPKPNLEMPASLARRPQYRGMPIPYMSPIGADGAPKFSVDDERLKFEVITERLCGLCGESLGQWVAFIGEIANQENRVFQQPCMHLDCLQYAAQVCPYIANPGYSVRGMSTTNLSGPTVVLNPERNNDPRPERMLIYITSEYEMVSNGQGIAVRVAPYKRVIWIDRV